MATRSKPQIQAPVAIEVQTEHLRQALGALALGRRRGDSIPILANVLVNCSGLAVVMTTTTLDVAVRVSLASSLPCDGAFTVPFEWLKTVAGVAPDATVSVRVAGKACSVTSGSYIATLPTLPAEEFPLLAEAAGQPDAVIPAAELARLIHQTRRSVTSEDTRYFLNGAQLSFETGGARMVSTDGHRLAVACAKGAAIDVRSSCDVLVPSVAIKAAGALLPRCESVAVTRGKNHIYVSLGEDVVVIWRAIEANFPSYEKVIPRGSPHRLEFSREACMDAIRRAGVAANARSLCVTVTFRPNEITFEARNGEGFEARERIPAIGGSEFPPVSLGLNHSYVTDALESVECERMSIAFKDEYTQIAIAPATGGEEFLAVLMPMRL